MAETHAERMGEEAKSRSFCGFLIIFHQTVMVKLMSFCYNLLMRIASTTPPTPLIFLAGMFDETMRLLLDAQDYFTQFGPGDQEKATPVEKLVYSSEMARITLRLSSVMAWLLARRAAHGGDDVVDNEHFRLAFADICLKELPEVRQVLPEVMCALLGRSLELYRRAARLDEMLVDSAIVH